MSPSAAVESLPGVGPARGRALGDAGYRTVGELLYHLPRRYEDRTRLTPLAEAVEPGRVTVRGHLDGLRALRTRRRGLVVVEGRLKDETGEVRVVWFNRPYLVRQVRAEVEYLLSGDLRVAGRGGLELVNPSCEAVHQALHGGRVVPIYPSLGRLGPAFFRRVFAGLFAAGTGLGVEELLPAELLHRHGLPAVGDALSQLHQPGEDADVDALNACDSPAHRRVIYGELLELQLELAWVRALRGREVKGHGYRMDEGVGRVMRGLLPFRLTAAQSRVLEEIRADLESPVPMLRLLQGDVGCGKTIVAALALVLAVESGLQGAFMAPTELLAEQHYATLKTILGGRYRLGLFTSCAAHRDEDRRALRRGEIDLAVGTHALIQGGIDFARLGLVVIDEQHRFGVLQRQLLQAKGERPDVLVMTATPIPRTLALTAYGDLDLSVVDELPPGRTAVDTEVLAARARPRALEALRRELDAGAQAYIVYPLIQKSDQVEAACVEELGQQVRSALAGCTTAVLHGRMPSSRREATMAAFSRGEVQALVATTVIEVGVDVPGASLMLIESAERFGLAQLHQLRGRVGRGPRPGRCIALHGRLNDEARRRLDAFAATTDGFRLAEADLELRGPGDVLGTRQAGRPLLRVADLVRDRAWLLRARDDAREILPELQQGRFRALRARLRRRVKTRLGRLAAG